MNDEELLNRILTKLNNFKAKDPKQHFNILKWFNRLVSFALSNHHPRNYRAYSRGQILKVDFGFNVGHELGGVHYAVTITKRDSTRSGTLAVIPLTSFKNKKINKYEVDLGPEFYNHVEFVFERLSREMFQSTISRQLIATEFESFESEFESTKILVSPEIRNKYNVIFTHLMFGVNDGQYVSLDNIKRKLDDQLEFYNRMIIKNKNVMDELKFMKPGSIAKVEQLRNISKKRIISPLNSSDALHGIRLSEESMEKINKKIIDIFVFDKQS